MIKLNGTTIHYRCDTNGRRGAQAIRALPADRLEQTITWLYEDPGELSQLIFLTRHLQEQGEVVTLVMPYVPNSHIDRVKEADEVFVLKYFAEEINHLGFNSVFIAAPHSPVAPALLDRVQLMSPVPFIKRAVHAITKQTAVSPFLVYLEENTLFHSEALNLPYVLGLRERNKSTGQTEMLHFLGEISIDKPALIVVNSYNSGNACKLAAMQLRKAGVEQVFLYATHCNDAVAYSDLVLFKMVHRVFTTNSIFKQHGDMIDVYNIEELMQ